MNGVLESASDVRSVPLGAKRKRGRPKKIPNCLEKSPVRPGPIAEMDDELPNVVQRLKKTTRKGKRCEKNSQAEPEPMPEEPEPIQEAHQSPVAALASQAKPGLGQPKALKMARKQIANAKEPDVPKPGALSCKKRKNTCNHEIVFGEHYNKVAWKKYADYLRAKKSNVVIDPTYIP